MLYLTMPTIRITDETWKELNRVAKEFIQYKRLGFEDVLRISPDATIKKLIEDWDAIDKEDIETMWKEMRSGEWDKRQEEARQKRKKENTKEKPQN